MLEIIDNFIDQKRTNSRVYQQISIHEIKTIILVEIKLQVHSE